MPLFPTSATHQELVIRNARIVLPDEVISGSVQVSGGCIRDIARGPTNVAGALDVENDHLIAGLVDVHTDHVEKQAVPRANVRWSPVSAAITHDAVIASAGITTVFDALVAGYVENNERKSLLPEILGGLRTAQRAGMLKVDHFLHLRCDLRDPLLLEEVGPHFDEPSLKFVTLMDDSAHRDAERIRRRDRFKGKPEVATEQQIRAELATPDPATSNRSGIIELCRTHGVPFANHDDTRTSHIAEAVGFGAAICEFPITVEAAEAAHAAGLVSIVGGPNLVAGRSHIGNASVREIVQRGMAQVVCSDYVPASLLQALWLLTSEPIGLSLPEAINLGTVNPARLFGLQDRGALSIGLRADIVRVKEIDGIPFARSTWVAGRQVL